MRRLLLAAILVLGSQAASAQLQKSWWASVTSHSTIPVT